MLALGLTGSIGMGKTTTARLFAEAGADVFDSDKAVHKLYKGAAIPLVAARFPEAVNKGKIDRQVLAAAVVSNPEALADLEAIVHPLVRQEQTVFLKEAQERGAPLAVLDIPLLFESGGEAGVDKTVVVTAPAETQYKRVMARPGMSGEKFQKLQARQMSDAQKRARADYIIYTDRGIEAARVQVAQIIRELIGAASGKPGRIYPAG